MLGSEILRRKFGGKLIIWLTDLYEPRYVWLLHTQNWRNCNCVYLLCLLKVHNMKRQVDIAKKFSKRHREKLFIKTDYNLMIFPLQRESIESRTSQAV